MEDTTSPPKRGFKIIIYVLIIILAMALTGVGVYLWQQSAINDLKQELEKSEQRLQSQTAQTPPSILDTLTTEASVSRTSPTPANLVAKDAFITAINAKDFPTLESMLAETVTYTKFETECCGEITRTDTMQHLQFINHPASYNFSPTQDETIDLIINNPELNNFAIGIGSDNTILAFQLNNANQVSAIFQAAFQPN